MKITFLGTGTSQGVPVIACKCEVCMSSDFKDKRLRSSVLIEKNNTVLVIDAGPDFRQQMLTAKVEKLDAVLLTHEHKDHISGLDDVRSYNYLQKKPMDIYAEKRVCENIMNFDFAYVFAETKYPGIPQMNMREIENKEFFINDIKILPIRGIHMYLPVLGFRIENFAYITDMNYISEEEKEKLLNLDVLVINALRRKPHISHFNLEEALEIIAEVKPKKAFLTHISHYLGLNEIVNKELPENVFLAFDMLNFEV
jgi:phosphoribosyl 1,2-cyclic phosphate phosphodiesterase